jgi:hypothetical protein
LLLSSYRRFKGAAPKSIVGSAKRADDAKVLSAFSSWIDLDFKRWQLMQTEIWGTVRSMD